MMRPSSSSIAAQLPNFSSPDTRVASLRALKNELIGHDEKKELWVKSGVLKFLSTILSCGKGPIIHIERHSEPRSEQEEARLQAIIVVGSIAQESVAAPLLASLRTLNTIADSRLLQHPLHSTHPDVLLDSLYTEQRLEYISEIISQQSSSWAVQQQISLAASLLAKTCQDEHHRKLIEQVGLLGVLATKLASFIVATGCSIGGQNGIRNGIPPPAPDKAELAPILDAVCTVMDRSKARWSRFFSAPAFEAVFPKTYPDGPISFPRKSSPNPIEALIPHLQTSSKGAPSASTFPGAVGTSSQPSLRAFGFSIESIDGSPESQESSVVPWLVYMARAEASAVARLMAIQAVTNLYRCGLTHKRREAEFAAILVPLLVGMLDKPASKPNAMTNGRKESKAARQLIKERAPAVLATLTVDSFDLQRAAIDAGSIKKLSQILKQSYDPLPPYSITSLWSPEPPNDGLDTTEEFSLGKPGLSPAVYHLTRMRESSLTGLAAIASLKDEFRKSIIENGIVPFIIQSLKPYIADSFVSPSKLPADDPSNSVAVSENPKEIILAACALARGLSRSVSTLRTALMDAGLATPLFQLLKHQDVEIQVAATAVVCNLVLDFSPMREAIIEAGILKVLCSHAHSMNAKLLHNSLWALKHLVLNSPKPLKISCLDELGPGWLKQIICNGTEDLRDSQPPSSMHTPNAAGMQVDLLNAVDASSTSLPSADEDSEGDVRMSDTEPSRTSRPTPTSRLSGSLSLSSTADDLAIQTQGLEFIRNLICGPDAREMIDYLFNELGQDKFFEILAAKLRTRVHNAYTRRSATGSISKTFPPVRPNQASIDIITSVTYILVHIAAGSPRHRQQLIAQSELLKLIVPLFAHQSREVRVCCAWLVINLTWVDDQGDQGNCRTRARELAKLGVMERLKALEGDVELDVRERGRTAVHQMGMLLR
ncbi:MAG: hypothetical protein Q9191_006957 [Dirinaria sp. TL-2023a]